jgi:hypothetical protein
MATKECNEGTVDRSTAKGRAYPSRTAYNGRARPSRTAYDGRARPSRTAGYQGQHHKGP